MAETFDFPDDLRAAQQESRQVTGELEALYRELPWSVEPHPGFTAREGDHFPTERPATEGWTPEQQEKVERLRARQRELATIVITHPYWSTEAVSGDVVAARMALKRLFPPVA
ncbi:hypothetical protein AB0K71_17730 [Streptomyces syringium]|uniref:hypothetical protein n=1 Tax=Streptomyces syringium TaxID=76729 RepID=UPI0034237612